MRAEDIYNGRKPKPLHRAEGGKVARGTAIGAATTALSDVKGNLVAVSHRGRCRLADLVVRLEGAIKPAGAVSQGVGIATGVYYSPGHGTKRIGIGPADRSKRVPIVGIDASREVAVG